MPMIPCQRSLFSIPDNVAYFNCAYMAPLLHEAAEAGSLGLQRKSHPWSFTPQDFFSEANQVRDLFARVIEASSDDIALIPSVSYGIGTAAANLPLAAGQTALVLEEQFPSNYYPWQKRAADTGAQILIVPRPANGDWSRAVLERIDARTAIAALPHCHWIDGGLLDLEAIAARLREVGAALVVDATQSLGVLPFDVRRVKPDFLVTVAYKWLLGPYALGFLYVAPHHQQGTPLEQAWMNRQGAEDFSRLTTYTSVYKTGARRYDVGEHGNFVLLPVAIASLRQILTWGIPAICTTLNQVNGEIIRAALEWWFHTPPPLHRAGHILGFRRSTGLPTGLLEKLAAAQVYASVRGDTLRVTPHLYNNPNDQQKLLEVLRRVIA